MTTGAVREARLPEGGLWSGPRPFVERSHRPELLEQAANWKAQDLPAGPVAVSGRLGTAVRGGPVSHCRSRRARRLRLEVFAERLGSPIDVALVVRNDTGAEAGPGRGQPGHARPGPGIRRAGQGDRHPGRRGRFPGPRRAAGYLPADRRSGPADGTGRAAAIHTGSAGVASGRRPVCVPVFAERRGLRGPDRPRRHRVAVRPRRLRGRAIAADADGALVTVTADRRRPRRGDHLARPDDRRSRRPVRPAGPPARTAAAVAGDRAGIRSDHGEGRRVRRRLARPGRRRRVCRRPASCPCR